MYNEGHDLIVKMSDFFVSNNSLIVDLGCSTGTLISKLYERNKHKSINILGIDSSKQMIDQALIDNANPSVSYVVDDFINVEFGNADLITSYYTIQFTKPFNRQNLVDKIYNSLRWGGAFFMFEKVRGPDARFQDILTATYNEYKTEQGYSDSEILSKSRSLKGVLEPFSTNGNFQMLKRAGFSDIMTILRFNCFEGLLCIK